MQTAIEVNQTIHQMDEQSKHFSVGLGLTRGLLLPANGDQLDPLGHFAHVASLLACSAHDGKILSTRLFALRLPQQPWVTWPRKWESGTHEPVSIFRWGGKAASPLPEGPLLGRSSQQQFLQTRWEQVIQGASKAVLLSGSPGSGKSRLTRWAIQHLNPSANCWFMDCQPARHDSPGAPLADWLARTCGMSAYQTLQERGNLFKQWMHQANFSLSAHCTDTLRRLLGLLPDDVTFTPTRRRRDMLDAFVELLTIQTQQSPLLLVVEDMHWADATTVSVLDAALTQLSQHPLMIVGTTRPTEHLPNNWSKLDITPLNGRLSLELIQHILSTSEASHAPAPTNTLKEMAERSGGNPLFIESLAYALVHTPGEFPLNLEEGLLSPIASDKDATQLAQAASVLGEAFDMNLTRSLCHALPEGSFHAALQRMMRHGLMHQQAGVLRFRHALIRDAVYACLPTAKQQSLHQQVIEASLSNSPELAVQQPLWLARHAEQAGMTLQAIEWYEMAAMQALSVASFAEAIAHFNKALALLQTAPTNPSTTHQALRLALGCANATVPLCGYGAQATRDAFLAVLKLGHAQPESNEVFYAHYGLWLGASSQGGYRQALQYVERLQAHADRSGDPVHHMQTEYAWGNTYMWLGELAHAEVHLRRALESCSGDAAQGLLASYSEDTGVIAGSLLAWVRWLQGNDADALALRAQALARAQALSHPYSLAFALACAARLDILRGDASAIEQHVNQLDMLANKHDLGLWLALSAVQKGWLQSSQGHVEGALLAAKGVELAAPALPALEVTMLSMQADALHRLGDGPGCLRVVQHALARCEHWDDRYMQPELLRLAAIHTPSVKLGREWLVLAKEQALNHGAKAWQLKLES
jgi:tetratricopeptide (TPR) repeat protein